MRLGKVAGAAITAASAALAFVSQLAPSRVGKTEIGFLLFAAERALPELAFALALGVLLVLWDWDVDRLFAETGAAARRWVRPPAGRSGYRVATAVLVTAGLAVTGWGMYRYAHARYLYLKNHVYVDYRNHLLQRAYADETSYRFDRAAGTYERLLAEFPGESRNHHVRQRLHLVRAVMRYGEQNFEQAKALEVRHGHDRRPFVHFVETLRVAPGDTTARQKVSDYVAQLTDAEPALRRLHAECRDRLPATVPKSLEQLQATAFEPETLASFRRLYGERGPEAMCEAIAAHASADEFVLGVKRSWNLPRALRILENSRALVPAG
jgi:hypothetical protein